MSPTFPWWWIFVVNLLYLLNSPFFLNLEIMLIVILETPKTIFVNLFLPQKYINLDFLKIGQFLMDQE